MLGENAFAMKKNDASVILGDRQGKTIGGEEQGMFGKQNLHGGVLPHHTQVQCRYELLLLLYWSRHRYWNILYSIPSDITYYSTNDLSKKIVTAIPHTYSRSIKVLVLLST
jgi:hypothetical protein